MTKQGMQEFKLGQEALADKKYRKAIRHLEQAAEAGSFPALISLARIYGDEHYIGMDLRRKAWYYEKAEAYLETAGSQQMAGEQELADMHLALADAYFHSFRHWNYMLSAIRHYEKGFSCRRGTAKELFGYAVLYFAKEEKAPFLICCFDKNRCGYARSYFSRSPEEVAAWMKELAPEEPEAELAFLLSFIYADGLWVSADPKEAERWARIAYDGSILDRYRRNVADYKRMQTQEYMPKDPGLELLLELERSEMARPHGPVEKLVSGRNFAAALTADGRALIAGENGSGVEKAAKWRNVVSVGCGEDFVAGVTADGGVRFEGDLWKHRDGASVQDWKEVAEVACGREHIVGLRRDGTLLAAGLNSDGQCEVSGWTEVESIVCGGYLTAAIRKDHTVLVTGAYKDERKSVSEWKDIVSVSCGYGHLAGLRADGTVAAAGGGRDGRCETGDWKEIRQIAAGDFHTVGLRADGTVLAVGRNRSGQCETESWRGITSVCCGAEHTVGLCADGTVVACGANICGQCDVGAWEEIAAVVCGSRYTIGQKRDGSFVIAGELEEEDLASFYGAGDPGGKSETHAKEKPELLEEFDLTRIWFDKARYEREASDADYRAGLDAMRAADYKEAGQRFETAYQNGNMLAGAHLGILWGTGLGTERDSRRAARLFAEAVVCGCPIGAPYLALDYRSARGVPFDPEKYRFLQDAAKGPMEELCQAGCAYAWFVHGYDLLYNYSEKNKEQAFFWLQKAAEDGWGNALAELTLEQLENWGSAQEILDYLDSYPRSRHRRFQELLGVLYLDMQDDEKALQYLLAAARQGDGGAMGFLSKYYAEQGKNSVLAERWCKRAADLEDFYAILEMAERYSEGQKSQNYLKMAQEYVRKEKLCDAQTKDLESALEVVERRLKRD